MEQFTMTFPATGDAGRGGAAVICGVVSSGNLEVLVEPGGAPGSCRIEVSTPAAGFREIWEAVLGDFVARHPAAGLAVTINDAGATPAVVSLRLDQAIEAFRSET